MMYLLGLFLIDIVMGIGSDCGYFAHGDFVNPIGREFCTSFNWGDNNSLSFSYYYQCSEDVPFIYNFSTSNCAGNYDSIPATDYWKSIYDIYTEFDYSCSDNQCDYVHYSIDYYCYDVTNISYVFTEYWVTDYCVKNYYDDINYYAISCEADTVIFNDYSVGDCSGFPMNTTKYVSDACLKIHKCSQSIMECGDTERDPKYHVGDIVEDVVDFIGDVCNSPGGKILSTLVGKLGLVCTGIEALGAICNLFKIDECRTDKKDTIVASCWSSKTFNYADIKTLDAFSIYIDESYGIKSTFETTTKVKDENYYQTEVFLDNCGKLDNYWIGGVYDALDNGEQNDIVSDVVEYLVNQGLADADNPVGGVSSIDQEETSGISFTDTVRSKRGLLLHYDELTNISTNYGIYFCEFNVVEGGHTDNESSVFQMKNIKITILLFIMCFVLF